MSALISSIKFKVIRKNLVNFDVIFIEFNFQVVTCSWLIFIVSLYKKIGQVHSLFCQGPKSLLNDKLEEDTYAQKKKIKVSNPKFMSWGTVRISNETYRLLMRLTLGKWGNERLPTDLE